MALSKSKCVQWFFSVAHSHQSVRCGKFFGDHFDKWLPKTQSGTHGTVDGSDPNHL